MKESPKADAPAKAPVDPGKASINNCVPATVPSVVHNSPPFVPSSAEKM